MKYINTDTLDDIQYELLSNFMNEYKLEYKDETEREMSIEDLKVDEHGEIFAPTEIYEFVDVSPMFGMLKSESSFISYEELKGYKPLRDLIKR